MTRLQPLTREDVPDLGNLIDAFNDRLGFLPSDLMTMARKPEFLQAFAQLARTINSPGGRISVSFKHCIMHIASRTVGCTYCSAHTAHLASSRGVDDAKLAALWDYETSPLFSEAERAALGFAQASSSVPNLVSDEDFARLREHYDEEQIVELLFAVCLAAFFTRWNTTMATDLEEGVEAHE